MRFQSGASLRAKAERQFGRRLTPEEWKQVDADGWSTRSVEYDEHDLEELLETIRTRLVPAQLTPEQATRDRTRGHAQRAAEAVRELVESQREALFGSPASPFATAREAAAWIEAQQEQPRLVPLTLSVDLPVRETQIELLRELHKWLGRVLDSAAPDDTGEELLQNAPGFRAIGTPIASLPYLPGDAADHDEVGVKRMWARPGSRLEQVLKAAERIEQATGWSLLAGVHHLLTDGLMSSPVEATPQVSAAPDMPLRESVLITVLDAPGMDSGTVGRAFVEARGRLPSHPQRSRRSRRGGAVADFVDRHPELSWGERLALWNREYPDAPFPSRDALRKADGRARKRH